MTGFRIANRYQAGDVIGRGRMSEVYRGRDLRIGHDVAIKVLRADLAGNPTAQRRFRREAQNAASLNHPSIVAVHDTGDSTDRVTGTAVPFIVMEFVDGRTLRQTLDQQGPLPPRRALEIGTDICAALEFSHRRGVVHRNISPDNVMLGRSGAAKVMDFGVARAGDGATSVTTATTVIGSAQYHSPEQCRGEAGTALSDIYATGCVVYEMLCGAPPFTGSSPITVASRHVREAPKPPSELRPGLPREVDAVVLKALSKNPVNRQQTAGELRRDLAAAMVGLSTPSAPAINRPDPMTAGPVTAVAHRDARRSQGASGAAAVGPRGVVGGVGAAGGTGSSAVAAGVSGGVAGADPRPANGPLLLAPVVTVPAIGEPDRSEPASARRTKRLAASIALGVAVIIALTLTIMVITTPPPPPKVSVPDVSGLGLEQATAVLQEKQLTLGTVTTIDSPKAAAGRVISQRPSELTQVEQGAAVDVEIDSS